MFCEKCGKEISNDSKFCPNCGQSIKSYCNNTQPKENANIMSPNQTQYVSITSNKSKITAIILCLLGFLCIGGLHRLYVGKFFSGILYLCTGGLFFIGTIIDLIHLLLGQFSDNVGQPLRR